MLSHIEATKKRGKRGSLFSLFLYWVAVYEFFLLGIMIKICFSRWGIMQESSP